jgi:hypothetical protein
MFDAEKEIIIGNYGSNCNWFINDTLDEVLVFNLYTDYHRMYTFHFLRNKFPINFLKEIESEKYFLTIQSVNITNRGAQSVGVVSGLLYFK